MRGVGGEGLRLIRHFEGFAARPYRCPAGVLTVGYGHVVRPGEDFADGITPEAAEGLLRADAEIARQGLLRLLRVPLKPQEEDALTSFVFNLGAAAFQRSTLRRKLNRGEKETVPEELRRWIWAGGRRLPGLVRRREAEARLFTSGRW